LRVEGTTFAYRPYPGQSVITVGRQKRKPGDPSDQGNDFVLRIAGDETLSVRISRRHFEIHRSGACFTVIDRSKVGTLRNGQPLPRGQAVPLTHGDRLTVAGVVTLEVQIEDHPRPCLVRTLLQVPGGGGTGQVILEASLGDMVTME
jgi:hypothetical protein